MKISKSSNPTNVMIGGNGAIIVNDTETYTGEFYRFKAVTECVINTATFDPSVTGSLNGVTVVAGSTIDLYRILTFKLTSGIAILYKA